MFLSIVTVTKNNLVGLKATYKSLQDQSNIDFEWIVIDGLSNDGTQEFLQSTNAIAVSEADQGIYDAMNKGIDRAQGDYILFLNAGDTLATAFTIAHIKNTATEKDYDFIFGDSFEKETNGALHKKPAKKFTNIPKFMFTHHQAMIYKRATLQDLRYDLSYKIAADYKFTYEFLQRSKNAYYISKPICIFESGGISQTNATLGRQEQFQIRKALNICTEGENKLIYFVQSLRWAVRRFLPFLYWR